jgi:TIR domain
VATLWDYYTTDFTRWMGVKQEHSATFTPSLEKVTYPVQVHEDLQAASRFISIYIPNEIPPIELAQHYVENLSETLKIGDGAFVAMGFGDLEKQATSEDLVFTGRMMVYAERTVPQEQINDFRAYCRTKGVKLIWLDTTYSEARSKLERPFAFICHDSRDKVEVAAPIAVGLQSMLCPVWYDDYSLGVGDSLRESIEKGIKEAGKCILILSPNFLSNSSWTKAEFDSIYTREIVERKRFILPVWHKVTRDEVYEYSPRLADRVAVDSSVGMKEAIRRLYLQLEK